MKLNKATLQNKAPYYRLVLCFAFILIITLLMSACGGGSRGTGTYGLDTMRPPKITEERGDALERKDQNKIATPTPTPDNTPYSIN